MSGRRLVLGLGAGTPNCVGADRGQEPTRGDMTFSDTPTWSPRAPGPRPGGDVRRRLVDLRGCGARRGPGGRVLAGDLGPGRRCGPVLRASGAGSLRRSLLLGYGTLRPLESAASFERAVDVAASLGFDEVVVSWPYGRPGDRFWSEIDVHREGVARIRA